VQEWKNEEDFGEFRGSRRRDGRKKMEWVDVRDGAKEEAWGG
jgi:hypothetical protein